MAQHVSRLSDSGRGGVALRPRPDRQVGAAGRRTCDTPAIGTRDTTWRGEAARGREARRGKLQARGMASEHEGGI